MPGPPSALGMPGPRCTPQAGEKRYPAFRDPALNKEMATSVGERGGRIKEEGRKKTGRRGRDTGWADPMPML